MWQDKNAKKEYSEEKNCQEGLWQESYLDGWTRGMIKNIGEDWREIGDSGKKNGNDCGEKRN